MIMADVTARILVDGRYMLRLWENDRASWDCIDLIQDMERKPRTTLACDSPETILKDGLLMIAIHCLEDKEIIKHAKSMLKAKDIIETSSDGYNFFNVGSISYGLTSKRRTELYAMNRKRSDRCDNCGTMQHPATRKLMSLEITIFGGVQCAIGEQEIQKELKRHHVSAIISYSEFVKGTERIRSI